MYAIQPKAVMSLPKRQHHDENITLLALPLKFDNSLQQSTKTFSTECCLKKNVQTKQLQLPLVISFSKTFMCCCKLPLLVSLLCCRPSQEGNHVSQEGWVSPDYTILGNVREIIQKFKKSQHHSHRPHNHKRTCSLTYWIHWTAVPCHEIHCCYRRGS